MSGSYVDAGSLDERLEILALREEPTGTFSWQVLRRSWAKADLSSKRSVFSARAVKAPGVTFTLRRQDLSQPMPSPGGASTAFSPSSALWGGTT